MITAVSEITDNGISEETAVAISTDVSGEVSYMHEADNVVAVDSDTVIKNKVFETYNLVGNIYTSFTNNATINYCYLVKYSDGGLRLHMEFIWTGDSTFTEAKNYEILGGTIMSATTKQKLMVYDPYMYPSYISSDDPTGRFCYLYVSPLGLGIHFDTYVPYASHPTMNCYAFMVDIPDDVSLGSSLPDPQTTILDNGTVGYDLEYDFSYPAFQSLGAGDILISGSGALRDDFALVLRGQTYNPNLLDISFKWTTEAIDASDADNLHQMLPVMYLQTLGLSYVFGRVSLISSYCGTSSTETLGDISAGIVSYDSQYGLRFTPFEDRARGDVIYGHFRMYIPDASSWDVLWNGSMVDLYEDNEMMRLYRYPLTQSMLSKIPSEGFKLYYNGSPDIYIEQKRDGVLCHANLINDRLEIMLPIYSSARLREDELDNRYRPDIFGNLGTPECYIFYERMPLPINIAEVILLHAEPSEVENDTWAFELVADGSASVCRDMFIPTASIVPFFNEGIWMPCVSEPIIY